MALGPYDQDPINFRPSNLGPVPEEGVDPLQQLLLETATRRLNAHAPPPPKMNPGASYLAAVHPEMQDALMNLMKSQDVEGQNYEREQAQLPSILSAYSGTARTAASQEGQNTRSAERLASLESRAMVEDALKRDREGNRYGVATSNPDGSPRPIGEVQKDISRVSQTKRNADANLTRQRTAHLEALTRLATAKSKAGGAEGKTLNPLALTTAFEATYNKKVSLLQYTNEFLDAEPDEQARLIDDAYQETRQEIDTNLSYYSSAGGVAPGYTSPTPPSTPSTGNALLDAINVERAKRTPRP
jgi:hypothetical protein